MQSQTRLPFTIQHGLTLVAITTTLFLALATTAQAGLVKLSVVVKVPTLTCPPGVARIIGTGFTGVDGFATAILYSSVGVGGTFTTPVAEYEVSPPQFSPVEGSYTVTFIELPENTVLSGSYLMASTHEWISVVSVPVFDYTSDFYFILPIEYGSAASSR